MEHPEDRMDRQPATRRLRLAAAFAAACAAIWTGSVMAASPPIVKAPAPGQQPVLQVATEGGATFDLAAHRGQWVLVFYWTTWCPPCTASLPAVSKFVAAHADVAAVGVAAATLQPRRGDVADYAREHPPGFPLAWVDTEQSKRLLGTASAIPLTWLIAPDGTLVKTWTGQFDEAKLARIMQTSGYKG